MICALPLLMKEDGWQALNSVRRCGEAAVHLERLRLCAHWRKPLSKITLPILIVWRTDECATSTNTRVAKMPAHH